MQGVIALLYGGAAHCAMVKRAAQDFGMQAMCKCVGEQVKTVIVVDTPSAESIARRRGLGCVLHVQISVMAYVIN